jgi:hypothetical protein
MYVLLGTRKSGSRAAHSKFGKTYLYLELYCFVGFGRILCGCILIRPPDGVADASALVLDAVHEALGPDEFGGKQAQSEKNHKPPGSWSDQHYDTNQQKREAAYYARDAANLFDGAKEHEAFWKGPLEEKEE